ncbi:MAG TPA: TldD/PmbA family protein [Blastocatellia bacterium]|nr:TldD/PmbA family protein [Blastocatellia bacterium]
MATITRRRLLQAGLGAGAGLALWELYKVTWKSPQVRDQAALAIYRNTGLDDAGLSKLLETALEKGGKYADIFVEHSMGTSMDFDGAKLERAAVESVSGAGIRVVGEGGAGFCATRDVSWEGLVRAARSAGASASGGGSTRVPALVPLRAGDLYPVGTSPGDPFHEKQEIIRRMSEAAKKADSGVTSVRANYRDAMRFVTVAASNGVIAHDTQPILQVGISVSVGEENTSKTGHGSLTVGGHYGFEYFDARSPESIGERAARMARHQVEAVGAPSGELPVVLGPAYSGVLLHEAVGHGLEADFNLRGYSAYSNRLGQSVCSKLCTIYDDGRRSNLNGSMNFDDEGVPSSSTLLIDQGRLAGYLHSRETAWKMGVQPTGNGRRQNFSFPPLPRMTNTYLQNGDSSPEDIIRSVNHGVYARFFSGGSVNITTGDFTFVPTEAFLIESGRLTAPLSNVLLLGNGPEILSRVSMVGNDMQISDNLWACGKQGQMVPVTIGTPTLKIDSMTVGGNWHT